MKRRSRIYYTEAQKSLMWDRTNNQLIIHRLADRLAVPDLQSQAFDEKGEVSMDE